MFAENSYLLAAVSGALLLLLVAALFGLRRYINKSGAKTKQESSIDGENNIANQRSSQQNPCKPDQIRFRVRPVYHGSELLIEVLGDHRAEGFPNVASILRDTLHATKEPHPDKLDDPQVALAQDRYFSFWAYPGGSYEIDDDIWGLFISAKEHNEAVIADVERALLSTGQFVSKRCSQAT